MKGREIAAENSIKACWCKKRRITADVKNAAVILKHSNAVVFRLHRVKFLCGYCPKICLNVSEIRDHSASHEKLEIFENPAVRNSFPLRIDISQI